MKRVVCIVWIAAIVALLAAPFGMTTVDGRLAMTPNVAQADDPEDEGDNKDKGPANGPLVTPDTSVKIALPIFGGEKSLNNSAGSGGAIIVYLKQALQLLSGLVGIVIILMLVIAGVGYITSIGDPGAIKNAKNRVVNALTALVLFLMMFAILNFIVPGGVL